MLKYGDVQIISNGNSKSLYPRNLTYRNSSPSEIIRIQTASSALTLSTNNNANDGGGGGTNSENIKAKTGDFTNITTDTLLTDVIKIKTSTNSQILINYNLGISDVTIGVPTYNFQFNKNAKLFSNSINLASPILTITDNVISINNSIKNTTGFSFSNSLLFDSALSGFVFPNINETDGNLFGANQIANNSMLIIPANYYLNYDKTGRKLGFSKYSKNYHFSDSSGNGDLFGNNIRFVKTDYNFTNDSTYNKTLLNYTTDAPLNTINTLNNLLNIEAKNIALGNGDLVLLNGVTFNPTDISNTPQSKTFNFKFSDIETPAGLSVLTIGKKIAKFKLPEVQLTNNFNINNNNADTVPRIQYQNATDFIIGRRNNDISNTFLDFMKFQKRQDGTGLITFLQPVNTTGQSQGVSLIGPVLDFSGNGNAFFTNYLNFSSVIDGSTNTIVSFNPDYINIVPDIHLIGLGNNQNIKFYPTKLSFINDSSSTFLTLDSSANTVKVDKALDLSSNGTIQFGTSLKFSTRNSVPMTIRNTSIDVSCNTLFFRQATGSFLKFTNSMTIVDNAANLANSKYLGFDAILQNMTIYKPLNFFGNGAINFQNLISFNTTAGQTLFKVYIDSSDNSYFDTSANLQFLNQESVIKFPDNGTLQFQDVFGHSYFTLNSTNETVDFNNPLNLTGTGQINVDQQLIVLNNMNINIATFSQQSLSIIGNLIFRNTGNIQVTNGSLSFIDGSNTNFMTLDTVLQKTVFQKPLQLSDDGAIYFKDQVEFYSLSDLTNPIILVTQSGVVIQAINLTGLLTFNLDQGIIKFNGSSLKIVDISNNLYMNFNSISKTINMNFPINIPTKVQLNTIQFSPSLSIIDISQNSFLFFDTNGQSININKTMDLSGNGNILFGSGINFADISGSVFKINRQSLDTSANIVLRNPNSKISIVSGEMIVNDLSGTKYTGFDTFSKTVRFYQPIDLSGNGNILFGLGINFADSFGSVFKITRQLLDTSANIFLRNPNPNITVVSGELTIKDLSNNIYTGFNTTTKNVRFYQPIDLSANGNILFGSVVNFSDISGSVVKINRQSIDTSANIILRNPNPTITFSNKTELLIKDASGNKFLGFDSSNQIIHFYKPTDLSGGGGGIGDASGITFNNPTFNFSDTSGNNYFQLTNSTKSIDISATIILNKKIPTINYKEKLTLQSTTCNEVYAAPIVKYNIVSENVNNFEKKYLAKTSIIGGTGVVQYYFRDVIDSMNEQITFRCKVISRDGSNNSASFIVDGYTKYTSPTNINELDYELNILYQSNSNWKINSFHIYSTDLVMEIESAQTTTTNWLVSIESISV